MEPQLGRERGRFGVEYGGDYGPQDAVDDGRRDFTPRGNRGGSHSHSRGDERRREEHFDSD